MNQPPARPAASPEATLGRLHKRLLLAVVALVVYGSLFPFDYQPHQASWADLWQLLRPEAVRHSRSDLISNVLLFVPLGLLLVTPLLKSRIGLALLGAAVLALGVQYLQFWFPQRDPSGTDALLNGLGLLLGWGLGHVAAPSLRRWLANDLPRPHFALLASALMLLWLADRWFPLVPTLDIQNAKNGLKPLLDWSQISPLDVLRHLVGWLVFLRLARYSLLQRLGMASRAMLCVVVVAVEPLFLNNSVGPDNLVGLAIALLLTPLLRSGPVSLAIVTCALLGVIAASALAPFQFAWVGGFQWVPFAGSLSGDPLAALPSLLEKLYWYGSLVFFVRYLGLSHIGTAVGVGVLLLGLELAQLWLPSRTPEITDPLLALLLASLMKPVFDRVRESAGAARPV